MAHYRGQDHIDKRLVKIEDLFSKRPRSFVFQLRDLGLRISGDDMSNVDFQANGGLDVSFDYDGSSYSFAKADVTLVKRLRSRKYSIEPSTVTIV